MSALKGNLSKLKAKLQNIQAQLEEQTSGKQVKEVGKLGMDEKVKEILNLDKQIITLNIGGTIFSTDKKNLIKDSESIFAILLNEDSSLTELFFDRNPRLFKYLLNYLRTGTINYKLFGKEELKSLYEEALFYEITDIRNHLEEKTKEISVINVNTSGEYIVSSKVIGDNDLLKLKDESLKSGFCCKSPGWIEFELNIVSEFNTIKIGGYKGNPKEWYSGNGAGAQILVSENGKNYKKVGNVSTKFSKEIVDVTLDSTVNAKFVKLVHSSYLGVGYFYIPKLE